MGTILLLAFLTYFSGLVASRAGSMGRFPWIWFFYSCLITPVFAWLLLEFVGPKKPDTAYGHGASGPTTDLLSLEDQ